MGAQELMYWSTRQHLTMHSSTRRSGHQAVNNLLRQLVFIHASALWMFALTNWRCLRSRTSNAPSKARSLIRASADQCLRQAPLTSLWLRVTLLLWTPAAVAASTLHKPRDCLVTATARGGALMPAPVSAVPAEVRLNSGRNIPRVGFGTFLIPPGRATYDAVSAALRVGYRHLDTAQYYDNERGRAHA